MNPIRTNKPVFFGDDGEVLKSGQIYIGQPNQWPLSFPKTVTLQDSAGSQFTAAQPLTTNNQGRIEYNGKSVMALVDGDYSILVRDRNGVTVGEGYTPFVENTDSGGGTTEGVTQVGLLLSDIKQLNVTPGETVRNVGKATTLDALGADWLVVSSTGNPADDIDLIDFANGTQGQRIKNDAYQKEVQQTGFFPLDTPATIVDTSDATAYRNVWTTLNLSGSVPDSASSVTMKMSLQTSYPNNTTGNRISVLGYARKPSTGLSASEVTRIGSDYNNTNNNEIITAGFASEFTIPLTSGSTPEVDVQIIVNDPTSGANNTDASMFVGVVGYTINYQDVN